jgi:DNA-binding NarL/FixJ family response regulator
VAGQEADPRIIRVLVCDDAPEHRALVRAMLADLPDVEIVGEASDGAACLTSIALTKPDVLVLDLQMPVKDGFDVLKALSERDDAPSVLVVSSAPPDEVRDRVHEAGAEFLAKGSAPSELAAAVRRLTA